MQPSTERYTQAMASLRISNALNRRTHTRWAMHTLAFTFFVGLAVVQIQAAPMSHAQVAASYGKLPLQFESNQGQADARAKYLARGQGYELFLNNKEALLSLHKPIGKEQSSQIVTSSIGLELVGASFNTDPQGLDPLSGTVNYMLGNDSSKWHSGIPTYSRVRYGSVYPGVDLVYYGNQQQLEYDFVVAAGADPSPIQLHFAGASQLNIDEHGDLVIDSGQQAGSVAFHKPVVYQMVRGHRRIVAGSFTLLANNSAGFVLGSYDRSRPLVIDPTLVYSTYLGGSNSDTISAIAVDSTGAAYLTGTTASSDYPITPGVLQTTFSTAFVTKLNASGTALVYSTFLGGTASSSQANLASSIAVDSAGNAYVTGSTYASNFPTTSGAFQTTDKAESGGTIGFVTKINPTGTKLVYSTFLGSSQYGGANALVLDSSGDAYIAGYTYGTDFPTTTGAFQTANNSASDFGWNEYVAKLNPAGSSLLYATCIGGSRDYGSPSGIKLAVDSSGDAFITATVLSTDFPVTASAYQKTNKATGRGNMTLSKLNPTGTKLLYATYLGGSSSAYGDDVTNGLAVDSSGNAYLAGSTHETNFPVTTGVLETTNKTGGSGASTGFVTKINPTGTALVYSTYLGGSGSDFAGALAIDTSGDAYITGSVHSTDFPVTSGAYQTANPASFNNGAVVFLTELNSTGASALYSTYFGGANSFSDTGNAIVLGTGGAVYLAGYTNASNFPITPGAYKSTFNSQNFTTGFVSEFTFGTAVTTIPTTTTLTSIANPATLGSSVTFSASVVRTTGTGIPTGSVVFSIDEATVATVVLNAAGYATYSTSSLAYGSHAILASYQGNSTYKASGGGLTETIVPTKPVFTPVAGIYPAAQLVSITDATANTAIYYTTDGTVPTTSSTKYTAPVVVSQSEEIQAIAVVSGKPASNVTVATYGLISAPTALAVAASSIVTPAATLNALVNTNGMAGSYYFVYGTSVGALTLSTPKTALGGSSLGLRISFAPVQVSAKLSALTAKTTYYYQVVVTTPAGSSSGAVLSFTTN